MRRVGRLLLKSTPKSERDRQPTLRAEGGVGVMGSTGGAQPINRRKISCRGGNGIANGRMFSTQYLLRARNRGYYVGPPRNRLRARHVMHYVRVWVLTLKRESWIKHIAVNTLQATVNTVF